MFKILALEDKGFSDFSPVDCGYSTCPPNHFFGPAMRSYYLIHYINSGCGTFKTPRGEYSVSSGQAFLIRPGEITFYQADKDNPWNYTWIGFTGNLASKFDALEDVFDVDRTIFSEIYSALNLKTGVEEYLAGTIFKLYGGLFGNKMGIDYVNRISNYINANYMNNIKIEDIAKSFNMNRKYLARIFKEKTGTSMQQYLISKRLSMAKIFLSEGYSVSEVARLSGYNDPFVLSKAFKKAYGHSPIYYKNKNI